MPRPIGIILAGGLSRRMGGGDKTLRPIAEKTMLSHVIERIKPQVEDLLLNANGDPQRFEAFALPIVADSIPDFAGPLAGIVTGMEYIALHRPDCPWMISVPGDTPFLPLDLVEKLTEGRGKSSAEIALAASKGRPHPVIGLWPVSLQQALRQAMQEEGLRKIDSFTERYETVIVDFPLDGEMDPFFNANDPEELARAEQHYTRILR